MQDFTLDSCYRLLAVALVLLTGCSLLSDSDPSSDESYFPLEDGAEWSYELVRGEVPADSLKRFMVRVTGTTTIDGVRYFVVENYFLPEPLSTERRLMRREGYNIYTRIDGEDHLIYSFDEKGATWTVPPINQYAGGDPSLNSPVPAKVTALTPDTAAIAWNLRGFPGSDPRPGHVPGTDQQPAEIESGWGELFAAGQGRVQLIWVSQAYGTLVWSGEFR